jgi:hypothetical protein
MPKAKPHKTYRLGSDRMVYAPSVAAWTRSYKTINLDRERVADVLALGWGIPPEVALGVVNGAISYTLDGDVVVITV